MRRREAILGIVMLGAGVARAQPYRKVRHVGVLHPGSSKEAPSIQREPFERGLRELGWRSGENVVIDYRYAEGDVSRLPALAKELARAKVDVIVARSTPATVAARNATSTIPIVMSATDDPVAAGFVASMSRPGGNITGISVLLWELDAKRLEILKDAVPHMTRVAVLVNPNLDGPRYREYIQSLTRHAAALKLHVQMFEARKAEELAPAFARMREAEVHGVLVRADPETLDHQRHQIAALAAKHRLPAVYAWRVSVDAGGLMSYSPSLPAFHHRAATYVSRILKGEKAGELPIEQPTKFELAINVRAARALALEIPRTLLFRADELVD